MTDAIYNDIRAALEAQAATAAGFPPPNLRNTDGGTFQPSLNKPWARLHLIPSSGRPISVDAKTIAHRGLFQIDLFYPASTGIKVAEAVAGAIKDAFAPGFTRLPLPGTNARIHIAYVERIHAVKDDNEWEPVSVQVAWRVWAPRN